jgi:purine-binding chemotaxis protein CheW
MTTSKVTYREFGRLTPAHQPVVPVDVPSNSATIDMPRRIDRSRTSVRLRERVRSRTGHIDVLLFRVGRELFALELIEVEEALDLPELNALPEMVHGMLGIFSLRSALLPAYAPTELLGVIADAPATALVLRGRERRVALAVDDVEDVATVSLAELRNPPVAEGDGLVLGVFRHGTKLVAMLEAETLLASCRSEALTENA